MRRNLIIAPAISDNSLNPILHYFNNSKFQVDFNGSCLKPDRANFASRKRINLCITFEAKSWLYYLDNSFIFRNSLYEDFNFTKNVDPHK